MDIIFELDPDWASASASAIAKFVAENPEFEPYLEHASHTPKESIHLDSTSTLITIKDMLKYYVSCRGGTADGSQVFDWITKGELDKLPVKTRNMIGDGEN